MAAPTRCQRKDRPARRLWSGEYLSAEPLLADVAAAARLVGGRILDVGCGNRPYASLLPSGVRYVAYDLDPVGSRPEVVGTASRLPFRADSFDVVLSTQVLEHVTDPLETLREARRVLRADGLLLLSAPQYWRLHEEPHDYFRYTRYGLRHLLGAAGFDVISVRPQGGVWRLIGQAFNNAVYARFGANVGTHLVFTVCNVWALCLERLWLDEGDTLNYMVHARKPGS